MTGTTLSKGISTIYIYTHVLNDGNTYTENYLQRIIPTTEKYTAELGLIWIVKSYGVTRYSRCRHESSTRPD